MEDSMMRRRFFFTAATALGVTLLLPLKRAWAGDGGSDKDGHDRDKDKDKDHDDHDRHRDEDDEEERERVTICEHGHTEQVTRRQLREELREGATLGRCHASRDD
jgi:hypothetical protein